MKYIKIPEGADTLMLAFNGEMSQMNDEQREAMTSLNDAAKAELASRDEEITMEPTKIDTPFKEAHGKDIAVPEVEEHMTPLLPHPDKCLPDPLLAQKDSSREALLDQLDRSGLGENLGVTNSLRYTQETLAAEFQRVFFDEIMALRNAGQKEYAHDDSSPFANFERGADDTGIDRKQILWIYAMKHKDGIAAALKGHTSQREDVRGRINDLIVYLLLLRGMFNEEFGGSGDFGLGELNEAGK
jgi:hypothetical protein